MPDQEKVIQSLRRCIYDPDPGQTKKEYISCSECAYQHGCTHDLMRDALALLREQEPRVLEYSEIEKHPLVWLEDNDKEDVIPALFLQYNGWNAEFSVQAPDKYNSTIVRSKTVSAFEEMCGVTWRAWSARPSSEQMRETKWEGEKDAE